MLFTKYFNKNSQMSCCNTLCDAIMKRALYINRSKYKPCVLFVQFRLMKCCSQKVRNVRAMCQAQSSVFSTTKRYDPKARMFTSGCLCFIQRITYQFYQMFNIFFFNVDYVCKSIIYYIYKENGFPTNVALHSRSSTMQRLLDVWQEHGIDDVNTRCGMFVLLIDLIV